MKTNKALLLILFFLCFRSILAQQDSLSLKNINLSDTLQIPSKSPTGALLRSAILPGWGQIYNRAYWKAPVIWAVAGYFIYGWIQNNNLYLTYKNRYIETLPSGNYIYKHYRDAYHDRRDLFAIYLGITYLLNIIDAYVDAELFDFDFQFNRSENNYSINLKFNFNAE